MYRSISWTKKKHFLMLTQLLVLTTVSSCPLITSHSDSVLPFFIMLICEGTCDLGVRCWTLIHSSVPHQICMEIFLLIDWNLYTHGTVKNGNPPPSWCRAHIEPEVPSADHHPKESGLWVPPSQMLHSYICRQRPEKWTYIISGSITQTRTYV